MSKIFGRGGRTRQVHLFLILEKISGGVIENQEHPHNIKIMEEKIMTETEKGYIAGLIDGEGTVTLLKESSTSKFRYPIVEMTSTTLEILEKFKETIGGGNIVTQKVYKKHYKPSWCYKLKGDKAIKCLKEVYDYLTEPKKKARAKLIIDKYKEVTPRNGKYSEQKLAEKLKFEKDFFEIE